MAPCNFRSYISFVLESNNIKNGTLYEIFILVLHESTEGTRPLGRPRRRWEDNIKMDLQEVVGGCGDWMEWAQDKDRWRALVSTVMNFGVP
jgi:hypothetical protein